MMLAVIALVYQSLSAPAELTVEPVHLKPFASFNRVRYDWSQYPDGNASLAAERAFNQEGYKNATITGVKAHNSLASPIPEIFLSVPRFRRGIPSTLNKLATNADGAWMLQPWPSWEMNRLGDCSALQFVQSFEIDPSTNMMWVIDVGSTATFSGDPDHTCPPKLMLIDLVTGLVDDSKTVVFTDQEASHTTNFLNDIVIDRERQICYITDTSEAGGIIGVNPQSKSLRVIRFVDKSMKYTEGFNLTIQGDDCPGQFPVDGIAFHPQSNRVYYCPLSSTNLYSFDASTFFSSTSKLRASVRFEGTKPDASDGMAMSHDGTLFFGGLHTSAVYSWRPADSAVNPLSGLKPVLQSDAELHWVDTFGFMPNGGLILTANKLNKLVFSSYDFSPGADANIRILIVDNGARSYLQPKDGPETTMTSRMPPVWTTAAPPSRREEDKGLVHDILIAVGCMAAFLPIITFYACVSHFRVQKLRKNQNDALASWAADDSDDDALLEPEGADINVNLNATVLTNLAGNSSSSSNQQPGARLRPVFLHSTDAANVAMQKSEEVLRLQQEYEDRVGKTESEIGSSSSSRVGGGVGADTSTFTSSNGSVIAGYGADDHVYE